MSLSLEVKKFINSEHIGDFVTVTLPSELPIRSDEIRAAKRERIAAEKASAEAKAKEAAEKQAEVNVKDIERELANAKEELVRVEKSLDESTKKRAEMDPEYTEKKAVMDAAKKEYNGKKSETDKLEEIYKTAEAERASYEKAKQDAEKLLADSRAALEKAGTDGTAAAKDEEELTKLLKAAAQAVSDAELSSKNAEEEATAMAQLEADYDAEYKKLNEASVSLSVEKRILEKQLAEAQLVESRSQKDYQRAKDELAEAEKQYDTVRESIKKLDSEKGAMRLAQSKSRLDTAGAEERVRLANHEKEQLFLQSTKDKLEECERKITETAENAKNASKRLEEARQKARTGNEKKLAEGLNLSAKKAEAESLEARLNEAKKRIVELKKAGEEATETIASAQAEIQKNAALLETATANADEKQSAFEKAKTVSDAEERVFSQKRGEFDKINVRVEAVNRETDTARETSRNLTDRIAGLELQLVESRNALTQAMKDSEAAFNEAERLQDAIRVVKTKYETAKMHYLESGKGEPMLLIHTAGQSLYTFRGLFYKLAMRYRVIALDLVGHGYSDRPDFFEYGIGDHAESIAGFMDAMGIESAHILGFSMGAGFALEFAKRHPDRVGRVIAISPGGITGSMPLSVRMIESSLFGGFASRLYKMRTVEKMLNECVFDHTVVGPHDVKEYFRPASDPDGRAAIRMTVSGFDEEELSESLHEIDAPVMIIWGADDKWHPMEASNLYRSAIPNATVTIVRNAGHLVHEEKPDRIYELVRSFVPAGYGTDD